jgi:hypothetical protein
MNDSRPDLEPPDERSPLPLLQPSVSAFPFLLWPVRLQSSRLSRQRRRDYHGRKIASDHLYRQVCLESPGKWRDQHRGYWKPYRQAHPEVAERNRQQLSPRDPQPPLQLRDPELN